MNINYSINHLMNNEYSSSFHQGFIYVIFADFTTTKITSHSEWLVSKIKKRS